MEEGATARLHGTQIGSLRAVINATGVILHTNLGRSPLGEPAAASVARLASGYTNLEYDLAAGSRGRRDTHAEHLLTTITGADLERASAAALAATGGGRVTGTEVGDEESYYEVEVTREDGSQVDVQLDESFQVVSHDPDHETDDADDD